MSERITPFIWINSRIEEAVQFYTSIFKNSKVERFVKNSASIELDGRSFILFNGEPHAKFEHTEAISMFVRCETQEEIDYYWEKLTANGGHGVQCGWLKDQFGIYWQVVPNILLELIEDPDPAKAGRAFEAMLKSVKFDIAALKKAHAAAD